MALIPLFTNNATPFQFDAYDNLSPLGGEVCTVVAYGTTGSDKHAKDIEDGYSVSGPAPTQNVRPIATLTLSGSEVGGMLFLTDDGTEWYGTMFGKVVGGTGGQVIPAQGAGTNLGPNTITGSGKITCWNSPGIYGVTLDALDTTNFNATTSLIPGAPLSYNATGKLTLNANKVGSAPNVARFLEWQDNGSLVTTPNSLTRVGVAGGMLKFKMAVIAWNPVMA